MKVLGRNIHISHGRYYEVINAGMPKPKWVPLTRVSDGIEALLAKLDDMDIVVRESGMQRAIRQYLSDHLPTLTPAVRKEHERMFGKIAKAFQQFDVPQVRPRHAKDFLKLFDAKRAARQSYKYRLSAFFSWCVVEGLCEVNPLREIRIKGPTRKRQPWTDDLFIAVGEKLPPMELCYHELSLLLYNRTTDVRHLQRKQLTAEGIKFEPSKTGDTTAKAVIIPWTPEIRVVIKRAEALTREMGLVTCPYIIHTSAGTAYTRSGIYSAYRRADEALHGGEATGLNPKALRPYALTKAYREGYSMEQISVAAAHVNQSTTEGYIQHHDAPVSQVVLQLPKKS